MIHSCISSSLASVFRIVGSYTSSKSNIVAIPLWKFIITFVFWVSCPIWNEFLFSLFTKKHMLLEICVFYYMTTFWLIYYLRIHSIFRNEESAKEFPIWSNMPTNFPLQIFFDSFGHLRKMNSQQILGDRSQLTLIFMPGIINLDGENLSTLIIDSILEVNDEHLICAAKW